MLWGWARREQSQSAVGEASAPRWAYRTSFWEAQRAPDKASMALRTVWQTPLNPNKNQSKSKELPRTSRRSDKDSEAPFRPRTEWLGKGWSARAKRFPHAASSSPPKRRGWSKRSLAVPKRHGWLTQSVFRQRRNRCWQTKSHRPTKKSVNRRKPLSPSLPKPKRAGKFSSGAAPSCNGPQNWHRLKIGTRKNIISKK